MSRERNLNKAVAKWEKKGWSVLEIVEGGMTSPSYIMLEKNLDERSDKKPPSKYKRIVEIIAVFLAVFLVVIWGLSFIFGEDEGRESTKLNQNISYDDKQSAVVGVLSGVWSDTNRVEKRFNNFLKTLESNDIVKAIRDAQNNKAKIRELTYKSYTPSVGITYEEIGDKKAIKSIEQLIKYSQNTNLYLQLYYSSFLEYVDNQKPSLLVKVKDNMDAYQYGKYLVISKSFEIGEKYDLAFDDYLEHWRTKEGIEADKTKRITEQKEAKKKKAFVSSKKYKKKSAQYALAKFITAWQYRDFKDMAKYTQTSWRERKSSPHGDLANTYDFKYLTSAKFGKSKCNKSLCNISVSITYENNFNDKIETHIIKPNVIKENGKWGVNPISALRKR